jgi:hypothetical protein
MNRTHDHNTVIQLSDDHLIKLERVIQETFIINDKVERHEFTNTARNHISNIAAAD